MLGKSFGDWLILSYLYFAYVVSAGFHKPFGCGGGSADANGFGSVEPFGPDGFGPFHHVSVWVLSVACFVEHTPVGTLGAANEDNHVVAGGKLQHSRQTVGHLATNGVVVVKTSRGLHVGRDILNNGAEAFQRFCGL